MPRQAESRESNMRSSGQAPGLWGHNQPIHNFERPYRRPGPSQDAHRISPQRAVPSNLDARGNFIGASFTCRAVGHRASDCPEVVCYACDQKGHVSRECRVRPPPKFERRFEARSEPRIARRVESSFEPRQNACECCEAPTPSKR